MTTFLPYPDFSRSADCLDSVRRWKQVVECFQLVAALEGKLTKAGKVPAYRNHPACKMWEGRVDALKEYTNWCLHFVLKYKTHRVTAYAPFDLAARDGHPAPIKMPWWFGDDRVHSSHRSNLLRKDAEFYGRYGWTEPPTLPYYWPSPQAPRNPLVKRIGG